MLILILAFKTSYSDLKKSENEILDDQNIFHGINHTISEGKETLHQILGIFIIKRGITKIMHITFLSLKVFGNRKAEYYVTLLN